MIEYTKVDVDTATELGRVKMKFDKEGRGGCVKGGAVCRSDLELLTTPLPKSRGRTAGVGPMLSAAYMSSTPDASWRRRCAAVTAATSDGS